MKDTITFPDFQKLDIKIGTIVSAESVEGSGKLLKLIIDVGGESRQVIAGIAKVVNDVDKLVGQQIPVLVNLEPKKMMGLESQGMILAGDDSGTPVLLHPGIKVPAGSTVR